MSRGWGWSVLWYREDGVFVVNVEKSTRIPLSPVAGKA
jgi:hypothetical protein